jgi:hypothetical protein
MVHFCAILISSLWRCFFDLIVHLPFYNIAMIQCMFISKLYFDVFIFIIIIIIIIII